MIGLGFIKYYINRLNADIQETLGTSAFASTQSTKYAQSCRVAINYLLLPIPVTLSDGQSNGSDHFDDANELDLMPLGTGSMLILFPRLPTEDGGLVIVRLDNGLDPSSVDLSSSGDSSRPVSHERAVGSVFSESAALLSVDFRGGVRITPSRLFIGELLDW